MDPFCRVPLVNDHAAPPGQTQLPLRCLNDLTLTIVESKRSTIDGYLVTSVNRLSQITEFEQVRLKMFCISLSHIKQSLDNKINAVSQPCHQLFE